MQLYDKYVEILLDYWNQVRNIEDITPERTVNVNELINILAPLAFWMHNHSKGIGLVKKEDLEKKLIEIFSMQQNSNPKLATELFLKDVRDYSCLLIEKR